MTLLIDIDEESQSVVVSTELLTNAEQGTHQPTGFDWLDGLLDIVAQPLVRLQGWIEKSFQVDVLRGWCDERTCCLALTRTGEGKASETAELMVMEPEQMPATMSRLFDLRPHPRLRLAEVVLHEPGTPWEPFLSARALGELLSDPELIPWLSLVESRNSLRWKLDVQWTGLKGEDTTVLDVIDSGPEGMAALHSAPTPAGGMILALREMDSTELWEQLCGLLPAPEECLRRS